MSSENLDASTFYVTTMGENQAPARQFFTECRAQTCPWFATPNGRRYRNLGPRSGQNVAMPRGLGPPELINSPGGPQLGHHESHLSSHFICAEAPNQTKAGPKSINLYTHGPTGTIAGGAHNRTFFRCAFVLLPALLGCLKTPMSRLA